MTGNAWLSKQLRKHPGASEKVLSFIREFREAGRTKDSEKALERQFLSGYCYYFAVMLQDAFGGQLYLLKSKTMLYGRRTASFSTMSADAATEPLQNLI